MHLPCPPVLAWIAPAERTWLLSSLCRSYGPRAAGGDLADAHTSSSTPAPPFELQAAALEAGKSAADPLAAQIGAANTLVRRSDGSLAAFNTDCSAAVSAIEGGLRQVPCLPPPASAGMVAQRRARLNASPGCTTDGWAAEPHSVFG